MRFYYCRGNWGEDLLGRAGPRSKFRCVYSPTHLDDPLDGSLSLALCFLFQSALHQFPSNPTALTRLSHFPRSSATALNRCDNVVLMFPELSSCAPYRGVTDTPAGHPAGHRQARGPVTTLHSSAASRNAVRRTPIFSQTHALVISSSTFSPMSFFASRQ